jgi:hypothetical protein
MAACAARVVAFAVFVTVDKPIGTAAMGARLLLSVKQLGTNADSFKQFGPVTACTLFGLGNANLKAVLHVLLSDG